MMATVETTQMPNDKKITWVLEICEAVKNEWMMTTQKNLEESY